MTNVITDHWAEISVYELFLTLVTRISNRIFLGQPDCYNKQWAEASMRYAEAFTWTVMILRQFPPWLHPVLSLFVPSTWNVQKNLRLATEVLVPIIEGRQAAQAKGEEKPDDLLQWLMDTAEAEEPGVNDPARLTRWMLLVVLGAAHTTTMAGTHAIYDLTAHPEYLESLREEVSGLIHEEKGWNKTVLNKMKMMDSFLKESQRLSPASLRMSFFSSPTFRPILVVRYLSIACHILIYLPYSKLPTLRTNPDHPLQRHPAPHRHAHLRR